MTRAWKPIALCLFVVLVAVNVLTFRRASRLEHKAEKFDQHCLSVRAEISTDIDMLAGPWETPIAQEHAETFAAERFAARADDIARCTDLDVKHFADCRFRRDWSCTASFMAEARSAIGVP